MKTSTDVLRANCVQEREFNDLEKEFGAISTAHIEMCNKGYIFSLVMFFISYRKIVGWFLINRDFTH